jgi:hypothetical protein
VTSGFVGSVTRWSCDGPEPRHYDRWSCAHLVPGCRCVSSGFAFWRPSEVRVSRVSFSGPINPALGPLPAGRPGMGRSRRSTASRGRARHMGKGGSGSGRGRRLQCRKRHCRMAAHRARPRYRRHVPSSTSPSTGTFSPGRTSTTSPASDAAIGSPVSTSSRRTAVLARGPRKDLIASPVPALAGSRRAGRGG